MKQWVQVIFFVIFKTVVTLKIPPGTNLSNAAETYAFLIANDCKYNTEQEDDLPYADDKYFVPPDDSIFFVETSCEGGLDFRQSCSIESAAKAHPNRQINVFFTVPVTQNRLSRRPFIGLQLYSNIKFYRIRLSKYGNKTPLKNLMHHELLLSTSFFQHSAEVIKFVTLYKFGGIFLDLDTLVLKSFDDLPLSANNFVGKEDEDTFSVGIIGLSKDHLGRTLADAAARILSYEFNPYGGQISNGIEVFRKAVVQVFQTYKFKVYKIKGNIVMESGSLNFTIYKSKYFCPIPFHEFERYFTPGDLNTTYVYAVHVWNTMSKFMLVSEDSLYAKLAREVCPRTMSMYRFMNTRRSQLSKLYETKLGKEVLKWKRQYINKKRRQTRFSGVLRDCSDVSVSTNMTLPRDLEEKDSPTGQI